MKIIKINHQWKKKRLIKKKQTNKKKTKNKQKKRRLRCRRTKDDDVRRVKTEDVAGGRRAESWPWWVLTI